MVVEVLITYIINRGKASTICYTVPTNNIEVGHHHRTQTIWPKYDKIWNNLQAKTNLKLILVVLQVLITCVTNGGKSSTMLLIIHVEADHCSNNSQIILKRANQVLRVFGPSHDLY